MSGMRVFLQHLWPCTRTAVAPSGTMQFETILVARLPRVNCKEHGVKTSSVPWADKHSRFTLIYEGFVVQLLQHCASTQAVASTLSLSWHSVDQIMRRAGARRPSGTSASMERASEPVTST